MKITLAVPGPPPLRTNPGRCADRFSPNAGPLARAGRDLVERSPDRFPIQGGLGVTVVFGVRPPVIEGYDVVTAIEEVLVDVGVLADERQPHWERPIVDRAFGDSYLVAIEPAVATGSVEDPLLS